MAAKSTPKARASRLPRPEFTRRLLQWFRRHGRKLPWRETRDPYRIIVSEFMLQQTQVTRVEQFYHRFLAEYPTIHALAEAPPHQVRESWQGLGYYRRAANLHRLARHVVEHQDGVIPADPEHLETLPGVGRYTTGAVASFAYEIGTPAVDTNVARVIRRAFHPRIGTGAKPERTIWTTAAALVPARGPDAWAFNQGIMELGALICTARVARCEACPVRSVCKTGKRRARPRPRGARGA